MASPVSLVEEFLGLLSPKGFKSVSGTLKPLKEAASPLSIAGEAQPLLGEKLWDAPAPKYKGFTTKAFATPELELTKEKSSPAKGIERAAAQFIERSRTKLMPSEKVRAERAKEQGYNVEAYHSTPTDVPFEEFRLTNEDIGMHFGTKQASSARLEAVSSRGERPRTYPVKLQANNPLELWDMGTWEAEKIEGALKHALKWDRAEVEAAAKKGMQGLRDLIKSKGYDSIKYVNEHEDPGSISYITLDPSQARSQFAKFNPRQSGKAHLAGALAGGAAAGALAMGGDEAQALPKIPTISGKMAGVEFKVTEAQYEQLKAARAAGAGREGISRMVEEFQRGVAPKGTLTPASVMDVESRVREAYSTLTRGQYNQPVYLKDIRDLLKDVPEQQLNRALHNIHLQPGATLSGINNPQAITPAIKAGGTDFKGTPMYVLWMQKQAPKAAAGGAAAGALAMGGDEAQAAPLAIAGEPQPLSVAGEAQPLAIAGKPQPLSIAGEAQPLGARPGISATDIIKGAGTLAAGPLAPLAFIAQYAEPGRIGKAPGKIAEVAREGLHELGEAPGRFTEPFKGPSATLSGLVTRREGEQFKTPLQRIREGVSAPGLAASDLLVAFNEIIGSPVKGTYRATVSEPVEEKTGIPKKITELPTDIVGPTPGLKLLGGAAKSVKEGLAAAREYRAGTAPKELVQATADDLHRIRQSAVADKAEIFENIRNVPPEFKNPQVQERIYHAMEEGKIGVSTEPPPVKPGFVRFYHGGSDYAGGKRWLSPDQAYAEGYAVKGGGKTQYVDIPENSPYLKKSFDDTGTSMKAPYVAFEAPENVVKGLKPVKSEGVLSSAEKGFYDKYVAPMRLEIDNIYNKLRGYGYKPEDLPIDPNYVHRIAKGKGPVADPRVMEGSAAADPIMGTTGRGLRQSDAPLQERTYFALVDPVTGRRAVISSSEAGTAVWHGKKATPLPIAEKLTPGSEFTLGKKTFKVEQATTKEIEAATPTQYVKNAFGNTADALTRMRAVERNVEYLDALKKNPDFLKFSTTDRNAAFAKGWKESELPQLKGHYLDPKLRAAFDDFYKGGFGGDSLDGLRKVNQFATSSIFWNPTPHMENVLAHWAVGRGWDWLRPSGMKSLFQDGARAMRAVTTQNSDYRRLLKGGSAQIFGGVRNRDFFNEMFKKMGTEIERNPRQWEQIARNMGLKAPAELSRLLYEGSRRSLWWFSDALMAQRVFELERKGMSLQHAIKEAEKHIPNYRIPTEIMGKRMFSQVMQDPAFSIFGRYHYGMWKSYSNMARDALKGTGKERFEALGNMTALFALTMGVYPLLSSAFQKMTGDPKTEKLRRGAATIPQGIYEVGTGEKRLSDFIGGIITAAPISKEIGQQLFDRDFFTGKPISEPAAPFGQQAAQRAGHLAGEMVSPYKTFGTTGGEGGRTTAEVLRDQALGLKNVSERAVRGKEVVKKIQKKQLKTREKRTRDPIEKLYQGIVE